MRKQPAPPPGVPAFAKEPLPLPEGILQQRREYVLITPLFGGGVLPNQADLVTVIRGTEIRAHLRFWWRACRGGQSKFNGDIKLMKAEEDIIWGSAATHEKKEADKQQATSQVAEKFAQPVQITVEILKRGTPVSAIGSREIPAYAAFPLQTATHKTVVKDISFVLNITYPKLYEKDIEAALWAWETFGGIGARTRRGFGALQLKKLDGNEYTDLPLSSEQGVKDWLSARLSLYIEDGDFPYDVPHLPTTTTYMAVTDARQAPMLIWKELIEYYGHFRQRRRSTSQNGSGYSGRGGRAGRSEWPEAEAIRSLINRRARILKPLNHPHKFPRAAFGLPINFHFKDIGDPPDVLLVETESGSDRMASPLILRPLACRGQKAVGIAILLEETGANLKNLRLKVIKPERFLPWQEKDGLQGELTTAEAENISVLDGKTDVLVAFLDYLDQQKEQ